MDADVMITIAFTLEVFLFALVAAVVVARRAHRATRAAAGERRTESREPKVIAPPRPPATANDLTAADDSELVGCRTPRVLPGVRVSSNSRVRNWGAKTNVALIFAAIAAVLGVAALLTAYIIDPPALGWVGFAIASALLVALGVAATLLVPRLRVSPAKPAVASDKDRRLLVVADAYCGEDALRNEIQARLDGAVAVHLVVPVRVSHLHFLANDEAEEQRDAEETMLITVGLLRQSGIRATGTVGSDKPLESMTDALATFPATHVLLALPPEEDSYWLERDLLAKARELTDLPVTQATIVSAQPGSQGREPAPAEADERARHTTSASAPQTQAKGVGTRCHWDSY
jgi:hypothetical protein